MTTPLNPAEITREMLIDKPVFAARNEHAGHVGNVLGSGGAATILVVLGGMFCRGTRVIELSAREMQIQREENGAITLTAKLALSELETLPSVLL